jgi:ligand-binding sensor domain-containing protein
VWIGSEYDGIVIWSGRPEAVITEKDGLAGNEVKAMVQEPDGTFWFGTENGLSRVDRAVVI